MTDIAERLDRIEAKLDKLLERRKAAPRKPKEPDVELPFIEPASDAVLDGERGNPIVRYDPRRWRGPSLAGSNMSECPPEYLRAVASSVGYSAAKKEQEGDTEGAERGKAYAALAMGWAQRNLADGRGNAQRGEGVDAEDDIPF